MSAIGETAMIPKERWVKALTLFILFTAAFSLVVDWFLIQMGLKRLYMAALMWSPGLAALLTFKLMKIDLSALGWKWGPSRYHAAAYLIPVVYGVLAYMLVWSLGFGAPGNPEYVKELRYYLGTPDWPAGRVLIFGMILQVTIGLVWHMATALGEEIGWRGFLTPLLMRRMGFAGASVVTGLVWALWHVPIILCTSYNAGPTGLPLQMALFTLMLIALSFVMTWLRLRSGSLWPAVTLHAAHNAIVLSVLQPFTLPNEQTPMFAGEFGLILPLVIVPFALYAWYRAKAQGHAGPVHPH